MSDLLQTERVRALLREAENANRLLHELQAKGGETADVRSALDGLYRDLGREIYVSWRDLVEGRVTLTDDRRAILHPSPDSDSFEATPEPTDEASRRTDEGTMLSDELPVTHDEPEEGWYTDEEEVPEGRLFKPGETRDRLPGDVTGPVEIPNPEWIAALGRTGAGRVVAAEDEDEADETFELEPLPADAVDPVSEVDEAAPWLHALQAMMEGLQPPLVEAPEDEGLKLDGASAALPNQAYPEAVRTALVGLLAARARHLALIRPYDPASGWVLARLRRQRRATGRAPVYGMLPDRAPETGSWAEDAQRWWALLAQAAGSP